ncbi:MAG: hypothetical protein L0H93_02470 [Nocardioides sp.]|nr:hypothetical protein [Nocardioides sp.]
MVYLRTDGSMQQVIGVWYDRPLAEQALDRFEATAQQLAAARGETLDLAQGADKVTVTEKEWVSVWRLPDAVAVKIGEDSWHSEVGPMADMRVDRQSVGLADPHMLAYAVQQARALLPTLTGTPKDIVTG